jgi:hypothetical protein
MTPNPCLASTSLFGRFALIVVEMGCFSISRKYALSFAQFASALALGLAMIAQSGSS